MPLAEEEDEEEEEGIRSIEDEGFELLNSTYNKISGPGRPGLGRSGPQATGNSSESVSLSSLSPELGRSAPYLTVLYPPRATSQNAASSPEGARRRPPAGEHHHGEAEGCCGCPAPPPTHQTRPCHRAQRCPQAVPIGTSGGCTQRSPGDGDGCR